MGIAWQDSCVELSNENRVAGLVADFLGSSMLRILVQGKEIVLHVNQVCKRSLADAAKSVGPPVVAVRSQPPRSCKKKVDYKTLTR